MENSEKRKDDGKEKKPSEKEKSEKEKEIDEQLKDTFPASDPPSYSKPGNDLPDDKKDA